MAVDEEVKAPRITGKLPVLPLKDVVVFPRMVVPLLIGRPASLAAVEESLASDRPLFLCAQRDSAVDNPEREDLYDVGVGASILQTLRMPDGTTKIVVEGLERCSIQQYYTTDTHGEARVKLMPATASNDKTSKALMRMVLKQFEDYVRLGQRISPEVAMSMSSVDDPDMLSDLVAAHLTLKLEERQDLLESVSPKKRLESISNLLTREVELFELEKKVRDRVRDQMERSQREYYLHEQMKAIQQELGQREDGDEIAELKEQIKKAKMPADVKEKAERELGRYERMPPMSPESGIIRTYLDWLVEMPWAKRSKDNIDIERARKVLDEDHYGLPKVKERILEFLAVRKLSKSMRGPVLCLVGPPGVGKTSLGQSVAKAMGRKFVRVSLGGVRDEAEIRGHRRTYIGAMPGRILQSMKKAGVKNPVFVLDEIDKMSADFRGDPSSAMLEVLDPEQNRAFSDHYLEVDFDLHEVFFITTANSEYDIPEPLLDRMEIVRLSGYTPFEKMHIAREFLIPKQFEETGVIKHGVEIAPEAIDLIIQRYTHEAGVRDLERQLATVCRKVAKDVIGAKKPPKRVKIDAKWILDKLGPPQYSETQYQVKGEVGVAVGLAWTTAGGDTLTIETSSMRGKGNLTLTGQLGEVMQESAQAAYTYLRAHAKRLQIPTEFWKNVDLHVHVPEGAIPKDGPSAGISMAVSMLSALKKIAPRDRLAMTGEITLQGKVLGIGGVKEKVLAAHRSGVKKVLLPKENEKDLPDVPKEIANDLQLVFVDHIDQVIKESFPASKKKAPATSKKPAPKKKVAAKKKKAVSR